MLALVTFMRYSFLYYLLKWKQKLVEWFFEGLLTHTNKFSVTAWSLSFVAPVKSCPHIKRFTHCALLWLVACCSEHCWFWMWRQLFCKFPDIWSEGLWYMREMSVGDILHSCGLLLQSLSQKFTSLSWCPPTICHITDGLVPLLPVGGHTVNNCTDSSITTTDLSEVLSHVADM